MNHKNPIHLIQKKLALVSSVNVSFEHVFPVITFGNIKGLVANVRYLFQLF